MRKAFQRSVVIIIILVLSVCGGYAWQILGHKIDIKTHPRDFTETVSAACEMYGVPENIVYSVILNESNFVSNKVSDDGRIGLMQLSADSFDRLTEITKDDYNSGMLYDPETNIIYGTFRLSYYYAKYGRWNAVLAACVLGEDAVEAWIADGRYTDENGMLTVVPDEATDEYITKILKDADIYRELYYSGK